MNNNLRPFTDKSAGSVGAVKAPPRRSFADDSVSVHMYGHLRRNLSYGQLV